MYSQLLLKPLLLYVRVYTVKFTSSRKKTQRSKICMRKQAWLLLCHRLLHVAIATNVIWLRVYFSGYYQYRTNLSPGQSFFRWSYVLHNYAVILPTLVATPMFDDNSPSAACLFLSLGHTLTSFIIRVICSVDCHLLLNHPET